MFVGAYIYRNIFFSKGTVRKKCVCMYQIEGEDG